MHYINHCRFSLQKLFFWYSAFVTPFYGNNHLAYYLFWQFFRTSTKACLLFLVLFFKIYCVQARNIFYSHWNTHTEIFLLVHTLVRFLFLLEHLHRRYFCLFIDMFNFYHLSLVGICFFV